jgi:hypothetical protein
MHPFSVLTLGIFVAGYITARWDLVTRLYELAGFAWNHGVVVHTCSFTVHEGLEALIVFPADSSRKGLRCPFNLLLPLRYTHRAVRRTRNVSGTDAPFRSFSSSAHQSLAPPGNQPRRICARAIAEERFVLELNKMRSWSRAMAYFGSSGLMVFLGHPHPV